MFDINFFKKYFSFFILIFILILNISCTSQAEKEAAEKKEKMLISDEQLWSRIISKQQEYSTDISWMKKIGFIDSDTRGLINLYTNEIQNAFFNQNNVMIIGSIKDIKIQNQTHYLVSVSLNSMELEMRKFITPKIIFNFICSKPEVDSVTTHFDGIYKRNSILGIRVAVVTNFYDFKDYEFTDSENNHKVGKLLIGDCKDILLAPQTFGFINKKLNVK